MDGIDYLSNLTSLNCYESGITSLDVSNNTNLKSLYCDHTRLTSIDVTANTKLTALSCSNSEYNLTLILTIKTATYDALTDTDFKGREQVTMVNVIKK